MRFFILLLPWLELFSLIKLGVETTALTALAYVLLTFVLGLLLLKRQGRGVVEKLRQAQTNGVVSQQWLLDDMAAGFAALLLMVPGVITDLLALLVAFGPARRALMRPFRSSQEQRRQQAAPESESAREPEIIEGSYQRLDDD